MKKLCSSGVILLLSLLTADVLASDVNLTGVNNKCNVINTGGQTKIELNCGNIAPETLKMLEEKLVQLDASLVEVEAIANSWMAKYAQIADQLALLPQSDKAVEVAKNALLQGQIDVAQSILENVDRLNSKLEEIREDAKEAAQNTGKILTNEMQRYMRTDRNLSIRYMSFSPAQSTGFGLPERTHLSFMFSPFSEDMARDLAAKEIDFSIKLQSPFSNTGDKIQTQYELSKTINLNEAYSLFLSNIYIGYTDVEIVYCTHYFDDFLGQHVLHSGVLRSEPDIVKTLVSRADGAGFLPRPPRYVQGPETKYSYAEQRCAN